MIFFDFIIGPLISTTETGDFSLRIPAISDLLITSNDYWYYDTTDGRLYYDEDADQFMEDAIEIGKVTKFGKVGGTRIPPREILISAIQISARAMKPISVPRTLNFRN